MHRVKELRFSLGVAPSSPTHKRQRTDASADINSSTRAAIPEVVRVRLVEMIDDLEKAENQTDLHFGLFIWPSALVLAQFVAFHHRNLFENRVVLELGCGIALPGILTALCGNAKKVILSDRADSQTIQRNVVSNIELNKIAHTTSYLPLNWGGVDLLDHWDTFQGIDVILAADCFYQSEDFEKVLATVALVFRLNPVCRFITAYQLRRYRTDAVSVLCISINRSIAPLLLRYQMTARIVNKQEFIAEDDMQPGFDSVYVYEITAMTT